MLLMAHYWHDGILEYSLFHYGVYDEFMVITDVISLISLLTTENN